MSFGEYPLQAGYKDEALDKIRECYTELWKNEVYITKKLKEYPDSWERKCKVAIQTRREMNMCVDALWKVVIEE